MRILSLSPNGVAFYDHIPISGTCSILSSLLRPAARYVIVKTQKGNNRPQGVDLIGKVIMESPPQLAKVPGWFFYALKHYLINVKTNVSNARMNIPKAIKSLKSKGFLSISTTPILCRIEVSHPATRLFLVEVYHITIRISTDCCHLVNPCIVLHKCTFFPIPQRYKKNVFRNKLYGIC